MAKVDVSLVDKFKKLETEILDILKENNIDFDESVNDKTLKAMLKKYISNVRKVEKLFEEYEEVAQKIEDLSADSKQKAAVDEAVVNLREDAVQETVEVEHVGNKIIVKRKKKVNGVERQI